ncbi:conjugal transfer protein [Listeria sp. FSL L7-1699]|uniref:Conjugal transfer protein n=1 Tax=Listeria farberi TaxID=2713500 RepID=A0ABR6SIY9_9LIST|nr:conjugal transfer protein [Listeria farberi]MBC1374200.1 conjugal transfer protein [Listeria farberi]MBC1381147.1 conjugal transfer protein [Listeria farberi]
MFEKFKKVLPTGKITREKKEKRKLPKGKKKSGKGTRITIWLCIILIALSGVFAYLKSTKVEVATAKNTSKIASLQKEKPVKKISAYQSNKLLLFTNDFLEQYITVPEDVDGRTMRTESLSKLYAKELKQDDLSNFEGYRELKSKTYFSTIEYKDMAVVQYDITYNNVSLVEKERKKKEKYKDGKTEKIREVVEKYQEKEIKEVHTLINIPVRSINGAYSVIENVFFTQVPKLYTNKANAVENKMDVEQEPEISATEKDEAEAFLQDFFKRYASSSVDDLAYMMKKPEALNGLKEFQEIIYFKAYEQKKQTLIKVSVVFKDIDSTMTNTEDFSLTLSKKDGKYFIEKLTHTLGGN